MKIFLVVGSESGNAEMVGDCVKDALEALGHEVELFREGGMSEADLASRDTMLLVSSSTGIGDIPQNIEPLFDELTATRPDLSHLRYGLVGLGDRNYKESFLGGPKKWEALLTETGAKRVGDRLELDATDNPCPDEDAVVWVKDWIAKL
ncbi:MAG: flavodoxin domain-containing protein [Myxococcota bacterium]|nr:flavodoxin domain-containing protein [Myxococcota bacterium]